jgi:hypothetical protein
MIGAAQVKEIVKQYEKHGWTLRRVLLCADALENPSSSVENSFGASSVISSEINALWFSRPSANGGEAWELRRLTGAPFAIIKVFGAGDDESAREMLRRETEKAIREKQN